MSAKRQVTRQMIIDAAYGLAKRNGMSALNARAVSAALGCSTRPIYLSFAGMEELKKEVVSRINATFQKYLKNEVDRHIYPEYKAYGMGYIRFAREEKQLFAYLFMRSRTSADTSADGRDITGVLKSLSLATGLIGEAAERFHCECWVFVHGIATMLATSYLELSDEVISRLLTDMFFGLKTRFESNN